MNVISQHRLLFPPAEFALLQQNIAAIADRLDEACHLSTDPQEGPSIAVIATTPTGRRGRPRKTIDPGFLREALTLRGPSGLAAVFNCHPRTIRRRAVELGLATSGPPVYITETLPDGTQAPTHAAAARSAASTLSDGQLDSAISEILEVIPAFGRSMIAGLLKASGHEVTRDRIVASYLRVHSAPGSFGDRSIHRKAYKVAGANSLWHRDGQHGDA